MRETWYVLEGGGFADPAEVAPDKAGNLMHKSGVAVAMRSPGVPRTSGVDPAAEREKTTKEMQPESAPRVYKTRESKSKS